MVAVTGCAPWLAAVAGVGTACAAAAAAGASPIAFAATAAASVDPGVPDQVDSEHLYRWLRHRADLGWTSCNTGHSRAGMSDSHGALDATIRERVE